MAMNLSDDDLRAAYYCAAELLRARRLGSRPIPPQVRRLYEHLDVEIQVRVSRPRQESDCDDEQLETDGQIGAAEAANLLGWSKRTVQRRGSDLDGEFVGGRWIFRLSAVTEYAKEASNARLHGRGDRATPQ